VVTDEDVLDDPLPDEKRYCEVCGTSVSFQWRKGPLGKSLCNSCGVKWKLKKYLGSDQSSVGDGVAGLEEDMGMHLDPLNDPYYSFKAQVQSLKKELKMATKDSETLASILVSAKLKDRDMDQEYRKLVRGSMDKSFFLVPPPPGLQGNTRLTYQESNNYPFMGRHLGGLAKKDALMELKEYMDIEDLDEEERTVHRFLRAIKKRRLEEEM
jgi:hypothetical protein